jgi:hypothetical protein
MFWLCLDGCVMANTIVASKWELPFFLRAQPRVWLFLDMVEE